MGTVLMLATPLKSLESRTTRMVAFSTQGDPPFLGVGGVTLVETFLSFSKKNQTKWNNNTKGTAAHPFSRNILVNGGK